MKKLISIIAGLALLCLSACSFGAGNTAVQEGACSIGLPTRNADGQPIGKFNFKVVLAPQFESEVFDDISVILKLVKEESNETGKIEFREIPCGKYIAAVSAESADDSSLKYAGYSEEFEIKPGENTKVSITLIKVPVSTEDDEITEPEEGDQEGGEVITEPEEEKKDDEKGDQTGDDVITDPKEEEKKDDPTGGEGITEPEEEENDDPTGGDDVIKNDDDKKEEEKGDQEGNTTGPVYTSIGKKEGDSSIPDVTSLFKSVSQVTEAYLLQGDAYVSSVTFSGENNSVIMAPEKTYSILKKDVSANPAFLRLSSGPIGFAGDSDENITLVLGGLSENTYTAPFFRHSGTGRAIFDSVSFKDYSTSGNTVFDGSVMDIQGGSVYLYNVSFENCTNKYKVGSQNEDTDGYQISISKGLLSVGNVYSSNADGIRIYMDNTNTTPEGGPFITFSEEFIDSKCPVTVVLAAKPVYTPFICKNQDLFEQISSCDIKLILADGNTVSSKDRGFVNYFSLGNN